MKISKKNFKKLKYTYRIFKELNDTEINYLNSIRVLVKIRNECQ